MDSEVQCGVLGPLRVTIGGRTVRLGADKQRALLATLALRAGRPVAYERLVDCVWGEVPPATARATLHSYAGRLRRALGAESMRLIQSVPGGYLLDAAAVRSVSTVVRQALRAGQRRGGPGIGGHGNAGASRNGRTAAGCPRHGGPYQVSAEKSRDEHGGPPGRYPAAGNE